MSDEDVRRSLEQTYEMLEEQYGPERGRQMRRMLEAHMEAYAGNAEPIGSPGEMRDPVVNPERMTRVTRETLSGQLPGTMVCPVRIKHVRSFSRAELERLSYGVPAADMDEKWNILLEDDVLHFRRSWTREVVFRIDLDRGTDGAAMSGFDVAQSFLGQLDRLYAARLLDYLVDRLLLARSVAFPFPDDIQKTVRRALFRHAMVGSGRANGEVG